MIFIGCSLVSEVVRDRAVFQRWRMGLVGLVGDLVAGPGWIFPLRCEDFKSAVYSAFIRDAAMACPILPRQAFRSGTRGAGICIHIRFHQVCLGLLTVFRVKACVAQDSRDDSNSKCVLI